MAGFYSLSLFSKQFRLLVVYSVGDMGLHSQVIKHHAVRTESFSVCYICQSEGQSVSLRTAVALLDHNFMENLLTLLHEHVALFKICF